MAEVKDFIEKMLQWQLIQLASIRKSDVMTIYGPMYENLPALVRDEIERMMEVQPSNDTLTILLNTGGGSVDSVERTVEVIRQHYGCVDFIIPDQAMSAGTVFALSGDNIYMDYYSQLGPIDPQFFIDDNWISVLGYLEKFEELNEKSRDGSLTPLEYALVEQLDLADLHQYEQAREHSVELLEKWLPAFKFKNWHETHSSGKPVTSKMKQKRAKEIALKLNDTKRWHAHSRGISMQVLQEELDLIIEDISSDEKLRQVVKGVHTFIVDFMQTSGLYLCLRSTSYNLEDRHGQS
ncbi:MAG: serine dehydrogenasease [Rhodothermaceae bacterium]|nr:serine dehydrogenasease [Rhodothermaceae bacterium]MXW31949.1 serine dehydrogenasease [Rhodothermaceae bacterium]MYC05216.1 serine dehydrogenasease [Rhodothermaceae bacterium]MYE62187.1 serine dehydrogenasease [Rhodothermaceae bacterium]MYI16338.1 serine dehydrogenasease [Rhodothermaceae bacterium]